MYQRLAKYILEYLSKDALWTWPNRTKDPSKARTISFRFKEPIPQCSNELLNCWNELLVKPFKATDGVPLIANASNTKADAEMEFFAELKDGEVGIGYSLSIPGYKDSYPGWFAIMSDAEMEP